MAAKTITKADREALDMMKAQAGIQEKGKLDLLDRARLAQVASYKDRVSVVLQRNEPIGPWTSAQKQVDLGMVRGVDPNALFDIQGWVFAQAGGGSYIVELLDEDNPAGGPMYSFLVHVPGAQRVPESIRQAELAVQAQHHDVAGKIAQGLVKMGIQPTQAHAMATQMAKDNPAVAMTFADTTAAGAAQAEDEDMQLMKLLMMQRAINVPPVDHGANGHAQELAELKAALERERQDARHREALAEERRKAEEANREMKEQLRRLETKLETPKVDPQANITALAAAMAPVLGALVTQSAETRKLEADRQAEALRQQLQFMGMMAEQSRAANADKRSETEAVTSSLINMMRFQLEAQKERMQEPVTQAEAMSKVMGMFAGVMSGFAGMAKEMMPNNPPWMEPVMMGLASLPEIVTGLLNPPQQTKPVERRDLESEAPASVDEIAAAQEAAALEAGQVPPEQLPQQPEPQVAVSPPPRGAPMASEDQQEAEAFLAKLAIPSMNPMIGFDGWGPLFARMNGGTADPLSVGRRLGELIIRDGVPESIRTGLFFQRMMAPDGLGWKEDYVHRISLGVKEIFEANGIPTGAADNETPEGEEEQDGDQHEGQASDRDGREGDPGRAAHGVDQPSPDGAPGGEGDPAGLADGAPAEASGQEGPGQEARQVG